jgi:hypothetical protein
VFNPFQPANSTSSSGKDAVVARCTLDALNLNTSGDAVRRDVGRPTSEVVAGLPQTFQGRSRDPRRPTATIPGAERGRMVRRPGGDETFVVRTPYRSTNHGTDDQNQFAQIVGILKELIGWIDDSIRTRRAEGNTRRPIVAAAQCAPFPVAMAGGNASGPRCV